MRLRSRDWNNLELIGKEKMFSAINMKNNITPQKVVLIACGSFNPVTNMHLRMFELGRDALHRTGRFHVISGIISPVSDGYQKKDLASARDRCSMIRQALRTSDWIRLDTWESEQPIWLETEKVLHHHRDLLTSQHNAIIHLPSGANTRRRKNTTSSSEDAVDNCCPRHSGGDDQPPVVKLLCGADLLESFGAPGLWTDRDVERLVGNHGLVCVSRAGANPHRFIYESDVLSKYQENITIVTEWMVNEISATKISKYINHLMPSPNTSPETEDDSSSSGDINSRIQSSTGSRSSRSMDESPSRTSLERSPAVLSHADKSVACMADISTLVRRVKNVRVVYTPETCV